MSRKREYQLAGGHAAIRASLHDGIALPRAFRRAGLQTDIFDASDVAECRMYDSAPAVWRGLLKNAGEGIATPAGIVPWTILLIGGQVLPVILLPFCPLKVMPILIAAPLLGIGIRMVAANRFYARSVGWRKYWSAVAHPLGVLLFLAIQWQAILRRLSGKRSEWRGRVY